MLKRAIYIVKNFMRAKAVVLMYHRIANPNTDVWEIAVSSENFEQHLQIIKKNFEVVSIETLVNQLKERSLKKNSIAITFDDGCLDNYTVAKPLLEKYNIPATFFIPSGYIGGHKAFWWDVLETVFLVMPKLPQILSINIKNFQFDFDLKTEMTLSNEVYEKHRNWHANHDDPPTLRAQCYYYVWEKLKTLHPELIEIIIKKIQTWSGYKSVEINSYCMSFENVIHLDSHPLFTIGCHTANHPALAFHDTNFQKSEIEKDKLCLESGLNRNINILAYPYGNYNSDTQTLVEQLNFEVAFTTDAKVIYNKANLFALPRYQVKNWNGKELKYNIKGWFK